MGGGIFQLAALNPGCRRESKPQTPAITLTSPERHTLSTVLRVMTQTSPRRASSTSYRFFIR